MMRSLSCRQVRQPNSLGAELCVKIDLRSPHQNRPRRFRPRLCVRAVNEATNIPRRGACSIANRLVAHSTDRGAIKSVAPTGLRLAARSFSADASAAREDRVADRAVKQDKHRGQMVAPNAKVFVVEGEIAAGKTELTRALHATLSDKGLSVCTVLEPVDQWKSAGVLQKFYQDPVRFAYCFQTYVYATRIQAIRDSVLSNPNADVFLLERSPASDRIFMELQRDLVDPVEMVMYNAWCNTYELMLPLDLSKARVLYLKTSLRDCMERLSQRQRAGEIVEDSKTHSQAPTSRDGSATGGVSMEYQARLRRAHEAFLYGKHQLEFPHMPASPFAPGAVLEIEANLANGNFRDVGPERDLILQRIVERMNI